MNIRTGDIAERMLNQVRDASSLTPDPNVYDYLVPLGCVLIRRNTCECLYIKRNTSYKGNRYTIALQGTPEEFRDYERRQESLTEQIPELSVVNWSEVEEMIEWAPNVPRCLEPGR